MRLTMRLTMRGFAVCVVLSTSICGAQSSRDNTDSVRKIDSAMESFVRSRDIAGAVTLVAKNGKVIHYSAVGFADIDRRRPMKTTSLFSVGPITQPIVATGIMILQDEGKLSINDCVSKYLPSFANLKLKNGEPVARELKIRECLSHTSGLQGKQRFSGSLKSAAEELATKPLAFQPRRHWKFGPGVNVAGRIIEVVSGQTLEAFLKEKIFDPLGMKDTTFQPSVKQLDRMATLYRPRSSGLQVSLVPQYSSLGDLGQVVAANPSGGLISHTRDLFRFYQMILNRGVFRKERIISAAAIRQMLKTQKGAEDTGFTPGSSWGLGWCLVREPQGVTSMLSKGSFGHGGSYGTQGWIDPKERTIYLLMIQSAKLKNGDDSKIRKKFQLVASQHLKTLRTEQKTARAK